MKPTLHLILGATGLGKTAVAAALAAEHGNCPVISLDRFQGYPEIAIGSGRPSDKDTSVLPRIYLYHGPFADGPVSAPAAADQFRTILASFRQERTTALVAEGGSISLITHIAANTDCFDGWSVKLMVYTAASAPRYAAHLAERIQTMLGDGSGTAGARTLLHELIELWDDPRARTHASRVIGYQEAIDLCLSQGFHPSELIGRDGYWWRDQLACSITAGHLMYAQQQRRAFACAIPALEKIADTVSDEAKYCLDRAERPGSIPRARGPHSSQNTIPTNMKSVR